MANSSRRFADNAQGDFFVDNSCIDCDACRQLAPDNFQDAGTHSFVSAQPATEQQRREALRALVCCPTGSIGSSDKAGIKDVIADFPLLIAEDVYYSGFNAARSAGGNSYFIRHPDGNWLIDSPRFTPHLVQRLEAWGGVRRIFLTHRDDVADADRFAARFGSERIIHRADLSAQPEAETILEGTESIALSPGFLCIPTPGHTRGHCALLYKNRFLFSGDHVWWNRQFSRLSASRQVCWFSWPEQVTSMERLVSYDFEWVLPGHGQRMQLPPQEMRVHLSDLAERMRAAGKRDVC